MKEAVGSYFLTTIVVTFIILFTVYLCLSININKAYKVKNEIINIIQKNNGFDEEALQQIQEYLALVGYRTGVNCSAGEKTSSVNKWNGVQITGGIRDDKGTFCIREVKSVESGGTEYTKAQFPENVYYQVKVFYSIDLPIVRQLFTFSIKGSTKKLYYPCTNNGNNGECGTI